MVKSTDVNAEMTQMLEFSDKSLKYLIKNTLSSYERIVFKEWEDRKSNQK
jgi:hypothetical protein